MVSALVFTGCDFSEKSEEEQPFENPYAEVGQLHNQALDHVLGDLKTVQDPITSEEELFGAAESSLRAFAQEKEARVHGIEGVNWGMEVIEDAPRRISKTKNP